MSLRLKINAIVGSLTLVLVVALLLLQYHALRQSVREEVVAAHRVALQLINRTVWGYAGQGLPALRAYLEGVGRVRSNEITLFDAAGTEVYRSPPSAYKAGRDAPQWFQHRIAPTLAVQSIALPTGRLLLQSDASRAALDAWDELLRLVLGALALVVGVNALVFWLVGRTVRPFGRIVDGLNALEGGRFDVQLPALHGAEAAAIGLAFNRMTGVLQTNLENERRAARAESELSDSRELARWVDHHLERERRLIARELHDELGQSVTAIRSMALSIAQRVEPLDAASAQAARLISEESSRLYDAMHGLIPRLAPLVLDALGLEAALADLVSRTRSSHPAVHIEMNVSLQGAALSPDGALALYRAAQEGMTNALRHGQARTLRLRVRADDPAAAGGTRLELSDDGSGLPAADSTPAPMAAPVASSGDAAARRGHHGLRWLTERIENLGGRVTLHAESPQGVRLEVWLPLHTPTEEDKA